MVYGIEFFDSNITQRVQKEAFENYLIIETAGAHGEVLKLLPPLTIENTSLQEGLTILHNVLDNIELTPTTTQHKKGEKDDH